MFRRLCPLSLPRRPALLVASVAFVLFLVALAAVGCGGGSTPATSASVTIEPLATAPAEMQAATVPEKPPGFTLDGTAPPLAGAWIDVNVAKYVVRLMYGKWTLAVISPVAVGQRIDTGEYASTQTGLFHVYEKNADLSLDAQYGAYISDWVGFDQEKANGFHSFPKDKDGTVVDTGTGRVSNGCIRSGASQEIFAFAQVGMPVYLHW